MLNDAMLTMMIPVIVPLILSAVKRLIPKIPSWWLPILAPLLGAVVDMVGYYAGMQSLGPVWGAALGSAGVGLREIADQTNQRFRGAGNGPNKIGGTAAILLLLLAGGWGCASMPIEHALATLTKPILGLAQEDAATTLAWVDQQVKDNKMDAATALLAKACPQSVADLAAYRDQLGAKTEVPGRKGLIYLGTTIKYGVTTSKAQVMAMVRVLIASCADLLPIEQVLGL